MRKRLIYVLVSFLLCIYGCKQEVIIKNEYPITPLPNWLTPQNGRFNFGDKVVINTAGCAPEVVAMADSMMYRLQKVAGIKLSKVEEAMTHVSSISFVTQMELGKESYKLLISPNKIIISATEPNGFFYAIQTLYQLLPIEIYGNSLAPDVDWSVPCVDIEDEPRFSYRGWMLDVARHYVSTDYIYRFIDLMAAYKINTFHWHLTDDQGWRIEIKKYPRLTTVGSVRNETLAGFSFDNYPYQYDGKEHKGFYTQEEIKAIVEYAARRYITVIPEIEMPGHASAAIAAYPRLSCTPYKKHEVVKRWGIFEDVFCPTEGTFAFLQDVLDEVVELFPGPYIHIGGDECPKKAWKGCAQCQSLINRLKLKDDLRPNPVSGEQYTKEEKLQSYFIGRIEKYVNKKGKTIIGWDEILEGGLAPKATVMSWRGTEGGIKAALAGQDAIMTPTDYCYMDYYQEDPEIAPRGPGNYNTLKKTYNYNPVSAGADELVQQHIIGIQANSWSEYMQTPERRDYQIFPRAIAIAETGWTKEAHKSWDSFRQRMRWEFKRLDYLGVKACRNFFDVNINTRVEYGRLKVEMETFYPWASIYYTTDGTVPTTNSTLYTGPFTLNNEISVKVAAFINGKRIGKITEKQLYGNLISGKSYATSPRASLYHKGDVIGQDDHLGSDSITLPLTNGKRGYTQDYLPWVGFYQDKQQQEVEFVVRLDENTLISRIVFGSLNNPAMSIRCAGGVTVETSTDGVNFESLVDETFNNDLPATGRHSMTHTIAFAPVRTSYVKLRIKNGGTIRNGIDCNPYTNRPAVYPAYLFIDEVEIY